MTDCVSHGKVIRMLTFVDDYTRECPAFAPTCSTSVQSVPLAKGAQNTMITRIVIAITMFVCLALLINLQAQASGDVEQQIKQLQEEATKAQMNNDVSWAQQHLADGFIAGA